MAQNALKPMRFISLFPVCSLLSLSPVAFAAPPAAPQGLAMTNNATDSITLSWYRQADEVKSYNIYTSDKKDGEFKKVTTVSERTATLKNLPADTGYFYKVSAVNAEGESALSNPPADAFTQAQWKPAPFPAKVAKNMCVTLGAKIISKPAPAEGKLEHLVDGSDATSCKIDGECEVKIQLNPSIAISDAAYLILNFRTDSTGQGYAYNINWRSLKNYTITESHDSTDGTDGTWKEVVTGTNRYLDGVVVIPNNKPKWIGIKNSGALQLCRLDIFRAAPKGFRNDHWIFAGDSLVVQDFAGGDPARRSVWFSDLVRAQHPDRYPIVIQSAQGGEMMENTFSRMKNGLKEYSAPNGTDTATGTFLCWEPGFNDVGVSAGLWIGKKINKTLTDVQALCNEHGIFLVPVRIEYSTGYLNPETLEPQKYNVFYNTLAANLAGVDPFARANTPYACDPQTQLPYADYWNYTRKNYATALAKDGVHHTKEGSDGITRLWAEVADKMIYSKQR